MTGFRDLSHNRDFTTLWVGETVNELGSRMSMFVFPLLAYTISGSALIAALVEGVFVFGLVATLLPAGALVDRMNRRALMLGASATGLVLYGSLAVAGIFWHLTIPHLAIVGLLAGAAGGIFEPAQMSAIRTVVAAEDLPTALSQNQARQHVADLLGAPLGGLLYAVARWVPFAADAVSFAVSCFTVSRIRTDLSAKPTIESRRRLRTDIAEGLRYVIVRPFFRVSIAFSSFANLTINALLFVVLLRMLDAGFEPSQIGLAEAAAGIGGILGSIAAPRVIDALPTGRLTVLIAWSLVFPVLPLVAWANPFVVGAALFAIMLLNPAGNAGIGAYRMAITPDELQGRVSSASQFLAMSVMPLAPLVGGLLLERLGGPQAVLALGGAMVVATLIITFSSSVRSVPRPSEWARVEAAAPVAV
ncbi:MAG: major facilitator superfamily 1 [Aeromicrobium sp.]|nr:major facilitator superfamily 1 [Aeromicrobium sp.]